MTVVDEPIEAPVLDGAGDTEVEHFDVLIVGAGLSGVGAARRLEAECPWADYAIFEARGAMGGTWDLFRYPGIRSDSDMFTLGYSFKPWRGQKAISDGASILAYIEATAREAGIDRKIRYNRRVISAEWSSEDARWTVTVEHVDTGETSTVTADFYYACSGYYRYDHGHTPDFEGASDFRGRIVHPQHWPEDLDYSDKRVMVIGSGATAITLVPAMTDKAAKVTMLQRSPTYVVSLPATNPLANLLHKVLPERVAAPMVRWSLAVGTQGLYHLSKWRPNLVRKILLRRVARQLPAGYDVATHFTPKYDPWDERLCAVTDGDLFKAIKAGKAEVVTDRIVRFTETGIELESGGEVPADIIVTATGLDLLFLGGIDLVVDGEKVDVSERLAYKGMMLEGVPNLAMAVGYTNSSWTLKADLTSEYTARLLNHMRTIGMRQCTPVNSDPSVQAQPLLGLASGYITRSQGDFPKQGSKFPWQVHQSYLRDYRSMHNRPVDQDAMAFSNPATRRTKVA